jgi:acetyl esterase/lipase
VLAVMRWATGPRASPGSIEMEEGVRYGDAGVGGEELLLDVYHPPSRGALRPAVILIHGGSFVSGSRSDFSVVEPARRLAGAGYVAYAIDYRLFQETAGRNAWPTPLDDAQRAVRWLRAHAATYDVDPQHVGAYGISAGGGLAAHLGVRETRDNSDPELADYSSRVACVVDLAGPTDGTILSANPGDSQFAVSFLGGTFTEIPDVYRNASPLSHIDEESAPFLVVHGIHDTIVPVEHSRRLVAALRQEEIEGDYVELPDAGHDVFGWDRVGSLTLSFLDRHLKSER